ncbi:MAG: HU family DNA-binding protein [Deltaproteobacteria bacterium]|nr:HU family DNA-binding protein [Deltaproteobacteria bacterium]
MTAELKKEVEVPTMEATSPVTAEQATNAAAPAATTAPAIAATEQVAGAAAATATEATEEATEDSKPDTSKAILVKLIAHAGGVSLVAAREQLTNVLTAIEDAIIMHGRLSIVGLGTFRVKEVSARTGRNPSTGEAISIPKSARISFKAGKAIKAKLITAACGSQESRAKAITDHQAVKDARKATMKALARKKAGKRPKA